MDRRNTGGIGLTDELGENKDLPDGEKPLKNTDKQYIIAKNRNLIQYFAHLGKHTEEESKVDLELLDKLLKDGARINCTDKYGQTCLHEVRINCTDKYGQTCLHEVRINCTDKYGQTCLHEVTYKLVLENIEPQLFILTLENLRLQDILIIIYHCTSIYNAFTHDRPTVNQQIFMCY